ncbi:autotransporter domain-containing protein [Allopusillimonas ginsengisoli]|uniref:autotransporter domain-containing protein n=1 Tax=Allopusillimonas ginsengisoli TaxID=453575 RepID=UPI00101F47B0|nr:autotransporter domain-containing protein [Allopusillimonas ginsengisoli]TEA79319.1 autotransporter domain-containing protein [Allopusillimonas ginsengisoli]
MNKIHKVIWSCCSNAFVVVSELAGSRTSGGGARSERRATGRGACTSVSKTAMAPTRFTGGAATLLAAGMTLASACMQPVHAQSVTVAGDVNPEPDLPSAPTWHVAFPYYLYVGDSGSGSITVANGGTLQVDQSSTLGREEGSYGKVIVTGTGSKWNVGSIGVGSKGTGELTIKDGGFVDATGAITIASALDSTGEVIVTGSGSKFDAYDITVGHRGNGTLTITDGASVSITTGSLIANWDSSESEVTVSGPSSKWTLGGELSVGSLGNGTLTIDGGGKVVNTSGLMASGEGSESQVIVSGVGSEWHNTELTIIGRDGKATLTIEDGGKVFSGADGLNSYIAYRDKSESEVIVSGAGSEWHNEKNLYVGTAGKGTLTIANGGKVSSNNGYISDIENLTSHGFDINATRGSVTVTGTGSEWHNTGRLHVGRTGTGTLVIADGGKVTSHGGSVSSGLATGVVTVTGAGSVWENLDNVLGIGGGKTATLTIADGGRVSSPEIRIGDLSSSKQATINIGAAEGDVATAAGILDTPKLEFWISTSTLVFNHTDTNYEFSSALTKGGNPSGGTRAVKHLAGTTTLTGDSSGFRGTTTVSGGTLIVDGVLGDNVYAKTAGVVTGDGKLTHNADFTDNGVLAGEQGKQLRVDGDVTMDATSQVNVALGSPSANGLFDVGGALTLDGALNVADAGGFGAGVYRVFDYAGALTDNGLDIGTTPAGVNQSDLTVQTSVTNQVNLVSSAAATGELRFWDGGDTTLHNNNSVDGGNGNWLANGENWTSLDGSANGSYNPNPSFAVFQGAAGTVTVDDSAGALGVTDMQFATDGYRIEGDAIALAGVGGESIIRVGDGTASSMTATIASELTGASTLVKSDFGTLVLQGDNSYTGGTRIEGGVLSVSSDANLGDPSGALTLDGGTLATTASFVSSRDIVMPLAARFDVASGTELELAGDIASPGAGSGNLGKYGDGTLRLSGINDYGGTRVVEGTLIGNVSSIAGNISNAGTVVFDQSSDATFTGDIKGDLGTDGVMVKEGVGTLTLDGAHYPYTSSLDWTISQGELQAKADRFFGDAYLDGAATALTFVDAGNAAYDGELSGDGQFALNGTGTLQLTGDSSSFTGATTVSSGTLIVDGILGGDISAQTSGAVSGDGTLTGNAAFMGGGVLAGEQGKQLRIDGDVAMDATSHVNVALGSPSASGLFDVGGALTLDGALNVANAGGFGAGVYRVFDYAGALTDNGLDIGTTPAGVNQSDLTVQTSVANQVNLVSSAAAGELRFWDGGNTTLHNNHVIDGGTGSWQASGDNNWTLVDGSANGSYSPNPSFAVFQGAAGLVTVDDSAGAIGVTDMQFAADGFRVEGDAIALQGVGGESFIRVGDGTTSNMTATIASELTGASTLVKSDLGTLVLQGDNSYTGGTRIDAGVLSVSSNASLGAPSGTLTFNGGTLATTASFVSDRAITLNAVGPFDVASATELALTGHVAGPGDLTKQGDGTLRLSGANAYGNTRVEAGTLIGNTSSISGHIANAGMVSFDQASDAVFAGDIGGLGGANGTMTKDGAGTLTLGGTSSLDWTIAQGGLQTEAVRFTGNAHLDGAATTLSFADAGNAVYGGVLSGNGQFDFNGTGQLQLTGDSSGFAGTTTFTNGKLIVGDSGGNGALGGSLDVLNGAILGGSGTVGSGAGSLITLASGGTLAPGNSIGTLTIAGDLVFEPGSRFEVEVDPQGADSDRIEVTGDATLNGGSVVHVGNAGDYKLNSSYTILTAGGTLTGAFDDVSSNFAFLTPGLSYNYGAGTVDLELERNKRDFASAAITDNQKATAKGIESIGVGAGHAVYDAIAKLPNDPALIQASFDALSGEIHASVKTALIEDSRFIRNAATDRLRGAFAAPGASGALVRAAGPDGTSTSVAPDHAGPVVWSHAFGSWGKTDSDGNAASLDRDIGGFLIGADRQMGDWRLGVMAGYSHSSFKAHDRESSAKSDSYHLGLYGATTWDKLAVRAGAAYSRHDIDTQRSVSMPGLSDRLSADYKANTFQVFGELGYGIELGDTRLEPFANLAYVAMHTDGYSEDGGAAALSGRSENMDVTFTTLGLRAEHSLSLGATEATVRGTLGWRHAFGDTTPESTHAFSAGDAFTVAGVPIAKDSAVLEAGVDLNLTPNATFGLSYIGQIAGSARDHGVKANLAIKF